MRCRRHDRRCRRNVMISENSKAENKNGDNLNHAQYILRACSHFNSEVIESEENEDDCYCGKLYPYAVRIKRWKRSGINDHRSFVYLIPTKNRLKLIE